MFAIDLRGFGDSSADGVEFGSQVSADDLHEFVTGLGVGAVHVLGQDISGATVLRLAAEHPKDIRGLTAVEAGLSGIGLEALADIGACETAAWALFHLA